MWISITDFGDSAVGLTVAALVLVALLVSGWSRGALAWSLAVVCCGSAMAMFKIAFRVASSQCAPLAHTIYPFSPSGHAALSAVVYGGLAVLGGRQLPPAARLVLGVAAGIWIALIASSRIAIQAHTPVEVVTGLAVGLGAVVLMIHMLRRADGPPVLLPQLAFASVLALVLMYGSHWQVESTLQAIANWLRGPGVACTH